ncbi:MAG: beta-Ala-His dipeptidase [Acutalibacteraceae bacterium]
MTKRVFEIFNKICEIPRGSGNTEKISDYVCGFAQSLGLKFVRDKAGNAVIYKPAQNRSDSSRVILQGHLDMVCEKSASSKHDFKKDKIVLTEENGFLRADRTTLGADDGIAVAYILSVLEDKKISHPAIEAVFTVDEETGMYGAAALDKNLISSRILINLDSEEEGAAIIGCAGGAKLNISVPLKPAAAKNRAFEISVSGLAGGHSGEEINKGRANAYKELFMLLGSLKGIRICSVSGGGKDNAIARTARAVIETPDGASPEIAVSDFESRRRNIFEKTDAGYQISVSEGRTVSSFDEESSNNLISLINELPDGVIKYDEMLAGFVKTSLNLGIVQTEENLAAAAVSVRSSSKKERGELVGTIRKIAEKHGALVTVSGEYPEWQPVYGSPLQKAAAAAYSEVSGKELEIRTIHAGLECGLFSEKLEPLDAISVGPDILGAHTPEERLDIESAKRTYKFLIKLLERI